MVCISCLENKVDKLGDLCPFCWKQLEAAHKAPPEQEPEPGQGPAEDDSRTGLVPTFPQRVPGQPPRELGNGRNTSDLWATLRLLGKDGWG